MSAKFIDTNIIVYLFSGDEPEKKSRAEDVVAGHAYGPFRLIIDHKL